MSRPIPPDPEGYAIDPELGVVHTRYAEHARGLHRTRTLRGVFSAVTGGAPRPCAECYPPPEPKPRTPRQARRPVTSPLALDEFPVPLSEPEAP